MIKNQLNGGRSLAFFQKYKTPIILEKIALSPKHSKNVLSFLK